MLHQALSRGSPLNLPAGCKVQTAFGAQPAILLVLVVKGAGVSFTPESGATGRVLVARVMPLPSRANAELTPIKAD